MKKILNWAIMVLSGCIFGTLISYFILPQRVKTIEVSKDVIREVKVEILPPTVCVDTFKTRRHVIGQDPQCDHPSQKMDVVVKGDSTFSWLEIKCTCLH